MPELPEVETTRCGILPHVKQQIIAKVIIRERRLRWAIPSNVEKILQGKKINDVERRAKYLLFKIGNGAIILHLGMSGHLRVLAENSIAHKHDHVDIILRNKKILRFNDPRRFGAFLWVNDNYNHHTLLQHLGIEPLTKKFSGNYLFNLAQNRSVSIKSFIMDNKIVVGVGNIYAAESLFAAGIHPLRPAQSLSLMECEMLVKAIKRILRDAIKRGGTTLKDFLNSEGKPGYFSNELKVYGRVTQPCLQCQHILDSIRIGQRSTVFCKKCQY